MSESSELVPQRRANLLRWMEEHSVSRTDLAAKLGVGRAYISLLFKPDKYFGEKAARSMEKKLYLPTGYLDAPLGTAPAAVTEWSLPSDLPDGMFALVPRVAVQLSAGCGAVVDVEENLPPLAFRKDWLDRRKVTTRGNLRIVGVKGDSMSPFIQDGDIVMIDVGQQDLKEMEIYAINYGGDVRIKRLARRFDGGLLIRSDNPHYPEESVSPEQAAQISILGRMLWRAG